MKRYLVFYGDVYYPSGGMEDFVGDFDSLGEAESELENACKERRGNWRNSWGHVWDSELRKNVIEK